MISLYGLKNCDTTRAAARWLEKQGHAFIFRDVRTDGPDEERLREWVSQLGWEKLLNRLSATWRALPDVQKERLDGSAAVNLIMSHPTLMKRPLLECDGRATVGFTPSAYAALFS